MNLHTGVVALRQQSTDIAISNPKIVAAAKTLNWTPGLLVSHINGRLESPVSRGLFIALDIGEAELTPKQFRELMVVYLGREPGPQDISSMPDPKHRNVSTSGATRLLDEYLEDVLYLLVEAKDGSIKINHLQAAWLVITCHNREGALSKLEELSQKHRSSEKLLTAMKRMMHKTPNFKELI